MKTKLFLLSLAVLGLRVGAGAQDTSVVFGTEFHIDGVPAQGGTEIGYQWLCNGDDIGGAQAIDYTTVGSQRPGLYTYVRKAKCAECENWQFSNPFTIAVVCPDPSSLRPVRFTDSATTVCVGTVFTYAVPNVAGTTYQWAFPAGWGQTTGANTNSVKVRADSATGSVSVTAIHTASGCASTARAVTVATVNKPPTLTPTDNTKTANQRMFAGNAIAPIGYTRGGTLSGNVTVSYNPNSIFSVTNPGTANITVTGTPTTVGSQVYTISAPPAAGCPTAATATGVVSTARTCEGQIYSGRCYRAKGDVGYNAGGDANCKTWFGPEYSSHPSTYAQYLTCPLDNVAIIFTGEYINYNGTSFTFYNANCSSSSGTSTSTGYRPTGVLLNLSSAALITPIGNTSNTAASVGHLCYRMP